MIDIVEQEIINMSEKLFNELLMDRTTRKNICWATDLYASRGEEYFPQEPITKNLVLGPNSDIISPRIAKSEEEQRKRTKDKAEVFTPSWICNKQNNLIDEAWFGYKNVFNRQEGQSWITNPEPISFPEGKNWQDYVRSKRLEISCGEAPYLVSRYDTVSGKEIPLQNRIGLLDRKLRIVNENTETEEEWFKWVEKAYQSVYGYEYQGDSLLLARENLLYTLIDNMEYKFSRRPNEKQLLTIARVISWNIWQMDGLTMSVPYSERPKVQTQTALDFDSGEVISEEEKEPIPCRIFDWTNLKKSIEFRSMINGGENHADGK